MRTGPSLNKDRNTLTSKKTEDAHNRTNSQLADLSYLYDDPEALLDSKPIEFAPKKQSMKNASFKNAPN